MYHSEKKKTQTKLDDKKSTGNSNLYLVFSSFYFIKERYRLGDTFQNMKLVCSRISDFKLVNENGAVCGCRTGLISTVLGLIVYLTLRTV